MFVAMNTFSMANETTVPAVAKAFAVLRWVAGREKAVGVSEIARATGISKATVHGLVRALRAEGALEEAGPKRYRLGPALLDLALGRTPRARLEAACRPAAERVARHTGLSAMLGVAEGPKLRIVLVAEGRDEVRVNAEPGMAIPLAAGATGKVAMAWHLLPVPNPLPRFTQRSITNPAAMARELDTVRERGVAFDRGEYLPGVVAAAAPVFGAGEQPAGILYAVGLEGMVDARRLEAAGEAVRAAAREAGAALGGAPVAERRHP